MLVPSCSTQLAPAVTGIKTVMSVINFLEVYAAYCFICASYKARHSYAHPHKGYKAGQ